VLDTEVYSNTGGQASKATPRGAVAKFAAAGKRGRKKDLGLLASGYGNVYVAQIAMGADMPHTVTSLAEAEAHVGPSLVIAYSTCIAHGIDLSTSMGHQLEAVRSGYWPLFRHDPAAGDDGAAWKLDSKAPSMPLRDFELQEARFAMLERADPDASATLLDEAQQDVLERRRLYEHLAAPPPTKEGSP
jgi:pyruvate-ferredoxin/flavodoxin oxidoreductase